MALQRHLAAGQSSLVCGSLKVVPSLRSTGKPYHLIPPKTDFSQRVASGKLSHNYGKSPFLMGKSSINGNFQ